MELNNLERIDYITFFGFKKGLNTLYNQAVYLSITIGFILLLKKNKRKTIANNGEHP